MQENLEGAESRCSFASVDRLFHSFTPQYEKRLCPFTEDFLVS